jgi:peptidoglycan/LPS O-acetylase OafA/YrhL
MGGYNVDNSSYLNYGFLMGKSALPTHNLDLLDALRGVAAYAVVFWHWQHFFYDGTKPTDFLVSSQPLFEYFSIFYLYGGHAVPLFFALSGVVFFWKYELDLVDGAKDKKEFSVNRFSRLYPLHFVTFITVALLQVLYFRINGTYFVYPANDVYHALLNLLLIPAWGFERGWSFNAPSWSVSVELLLYITFALGCFLTGRSRYLSFVALILLGYLLPPSAYKIAEGLTQFYTAGILFVAYRITHKRLGTIATVIFVIPAVLSWLMLTVFPSMKEQIIGTILFPTIVVALAAVNFCNEVRLNFFRWLGKISYAIYLWHFPLQILTALIITELGYSKSVFNSPIALPAFILFTTAISTLSFFLFERPLQSKIRRDFKRRYSIA